MQRWWRWKVVVMMKLLYGQLASNYDYNEYVVFEESSFVRWSIYLGCPIWNIYSWLYIGNFSRSATLNTNSLHYYCKTHKLLNMSITYYSHPSLDHAPTPSTKRKSFPKLNYGISPMYRRVVTSIMGIDHIDGNQHGLYYEASIFRWLIFYQVT